MHFINSQEFPPSLISMYYNYQCIKIYIKRDKDQWTKAVYARFIYSLLVCEPYAKNLYKLNKIYWQY
jgi:hypothetical protein